MKFFKVWMPAIVLFLVAALGLAGCGGGGGGGGGGTVNPPAATVPAAPTGVSATPSATNLQVNIAWTPVAGLTYNIYYSTTQGTGVNGTPILTQASPYLQTTGLAPNTTYYYVVTAVNSVGESAASDEKSATTANLTPAPTGVVAAPGNVQVALSWAAVSGAATYNVYGDTSPGVAAVSGNLITSTATLSSLQSGLTNGATYYYVVTAVVNGKESAPSAEVSAVPSLTPAPAVVTAYESNILGSGEVGVKWTAVTGATSYNVYYSTFPNITIGGGSVTKISGLTSSNAQGYPVAGLPVGTYFFVVTAVNSFGESTTSPEASAIPPQFTTDMVSGKTLKYTDTNSGGTFTFVCAASTTATGSLTFTSTLSGVSSSGTGTWTVNDSNDLTVTIPTGSLTFRYEVAQSSGTSLLNVLFYNGTQGAVSGQITIK